MNFRYCIVVIRGSFRLESYFKGYSMLKKLRMADCLLPPTQPICVVSRFSLLFYCLCILTSLLQCSSDSFHMLYGCCLLFSVLTSAWFLVFASVSCCCTLHTLSGLCILSWVHLWAVTWFQLATSLSPPSGSHGEEAGWGLDAANWGILELVNYKGSLSQTPDMWMQKGWVLMHTCCTYLSIGSRSFCAKSAFTVRSQHKD